MLSVFDSFFEAGWAWLANGDTANVLVLMGVTVFTAIFGGTALYPSLVVSAALVAGVHYVLTNWVGVHSYAWPISVACVVLMLAGLSIRAERNVAKASRRHEFELTVVGAQFPGKRITVLSTGNWLLTDIASGRTYCELTLDARETILKMHSPENTNQSKF